MSGFFESIANGFRNNMHYNPFNDAINQDFNDPKTWARIGALSGVNPNSIGGPAAKLMVGAGQGAQQGLGYKQGQQQITQANLTFQQQLSRINHWRTQLGYKPITSDDVAKSTAFPTDAAAPAQAPQGSPQAALTAQQKSPFDSFYDNFLAPHEGGFTPSDGNGQPANFGINQGANPDVSVKDLTPDKAKQLAYDRYWKVSGADKMNPALGAIQADTAFNMGPGAAFQMLQASGGDPQKYLALREQKYKAIAAADPSKATSLPGWLKRNEDLAQYVASNGAVPPQQFQGQPESQDGGIPPAMQNVLAQIGMYDPDKADALQFELMQKQKHLMTPEEVRAANLPDKTVATRSIDGSINVEWKPPPMFTPVSQQEAKDAPYLSGFDASGKPVYKPQGTYTLLSPQAIKDGAATWILTGKLPGSMRDKASVSAMLNAAEDFKPKGMNPQDWSWMIQNNKLALQAKTTAAGQAAKSQVATAVNEGTVNNSIKILRDLLPVAASHGKFTDLNEMSQWMARKTNSATAANFKNAIDSISNEYARIMTGSTTGAPTSDAARREAADRIIYGYNQGTIDSVLGQMQAEMRGRSESYASVLKELTGGQFAGAEVPGALQSAPQQQKTSAPSPTGKSRGVYNPATQRIEYH